MKILQLNTDYKSSEGTPFSEFEEKVLTYVRANFALNTQRIYKNTFKQFGKHIQGKNIEQITIFDIENYKAFRTKTVNKSTCNIDIRTLKSAFNLAVNWEILPNNPAEKVKQFRIEEKEILSFANEEVQTLLAVIDDQVINDIVRFTLNTGMRISEVINLQGKDYDPKEKTIHVKNKDGFATKSRRNREIPLNKSSLEIVKKYHKEEEDYLFKNSCSRQFDKDHLTRRFKIYVRKAQLPEKFHFHCLRHTFITEAVKKGVQPIFVKELAGHADIKTTMNYVHIVTDDMREAVDSLCF